MHCFAQIPKTGQQTASAKTTVPLQVPFGQSREVNRVLHSQHTIGNQTVHQPMHVKPSGGDASPDATSSHVGHDFSRIPVYAETSVQIQSKLAVNARGDIYEQEAARVAEQVMRMPQPKIQRACACGGECPKCSNSSDSHRHYSAMCSVSRPSASRISEGQVLRQEGARYYQTDPNLPANQPTIGGFFFCDPPLYDADQIRRALDTAKLWVASAILRLDQFTTGGQAIEEETAVRVALRDNFNITETHPRVTLLPKTPLETVLDNFNLIERALNQTLQFYCTSACRPGDLAWVLGNPEALGLPRGIINMCQGFFGCDPLKQASTIIHERAHDALRAKDHAYEVSSAYDSLPTIMALENAESYAVAARQIYHGGIHGPGLSCRPATSRIGRLELLEPTFPPPRAPRPTLLPRP